MVKKVVKKAIDKIYFLNREQKFKNTFNLKKVIDKRFVPFECRLQGKTLYVNDIATLRLGWEELFINEAYKFKTNSPHPLIIDCGANIGLSTIYFKTLYPESKIIAFEADPNIYSFLCKNIESFGYKDITHYNLAVWNKNDSVLSFLSEGGAGGRIEDKSTDQQYIKVKTARLKDYISKNERIDFLKIDIEGAEYNVLLDCAHNLTNVMALFIEYHSMPDTPQILDEILAVIKQAGFRYQVEHLFLSKHPYISQELNHGMDLQLNIFCYRIR